MNKITRQAHKHARQRQKRNRAITFSIIVIGVLGIAGYLLASAFSRPVLEPADNVIDIAADMAGFDRQEIRVKVGVPVTLRLTSLDNQFHTDGGGKHQWGVDEFEVSMIAPPEGVNTVTFTPDQPGTYTYHNGRIEVTSDGIGRGSTFRFSIPQHPV